MSQRSQEVLDKPHTNIGAQDLLKIDLTYSGFLRKRGRLERIVGSLRPLSLILPRLAKWRQRYVILSRGCLYVYGDEFSTSPLLAVSLKRYNKVERYDLKKELEDPEEIRKRSFVVQPDSVNQKTLIFACAKDHERREWMGKIKDEMLKANGMKMMSAADYGDYVSLEELVKMRKANFFPSPNNTRLQQQKSARHQSLPRLPGESSDDSDCSDYDRIEEIAELPPAKPLKPKSKPQVAEKPQPKPKKRLPSEEDYIFNESDRSKAESILQTKKSGTFLVRDSRSTDQKVLSVQTSEGMKEYKIFKKENTVTINNINYFKNMDMLIKHYKKECLPNRSMTLSRGYSIKEE